MNVISLYSKAADNGLSTGCVALMVDRFFVCMCIFILYAYKSSTIYIYKIEI